MDSRKSTNFMDFVYSPIDKTVFGRTASSWGKLLIYHITFLLILFGFFFLLMMASLSIMVLLKEPFYNKQYLGLDAPSIAISAFPMANLKWPIISVAKMEENAYLKYIDIIQKRLSNYTSVNVIHCDDYNLRPDYRNLKSHKYIKRFFDSLSNNTTKARDISTKDRFMITKLYENSTTSSTNMINNINRDEWSNNVPCAFSITSLGPCAEYPYGYNTWKPCFYLKVNKVFRLKSIPYNKSSVLPKNMPNEVKRLIKTSDKPKFWIHCEGNDIWDKHNLGNILYYPEQSFETLYFPYTGNKQYQSPLVGIQLTDFKRNVKINIRCFLWLQELSAVETTLQIFFGN